MAESAGHIALAAVTALAWLGAGTLLLRPLGGSGDRLLDWLNRLAAGAVLFGTATFAAGWLGFVSAPATIAVTAVAAAGGGATLRPLLRAARLPSLRGWPRWQVALLALLVLYALVDILATCAPISSPDALYYHTADPEHFERWGEIRELPNAWVSYQPYLVQMLVLDGLLLWNVLQGAFAPLILTLGAAAAVAGAAHRLGGRTLGLLAAAIFLAQPFMTWTATSTFVEGPLAFFVALAAWNAARWLRGGRAEALALAGLFAGAAAATKYTGAAAAVAVGLVVLALGRRRITARALATLVLPALLIAVPWYAKNAILTGDPLYPLLAGGPNPEAEEARRQVLEGYGRGRSPLDFLLLPFRLLSDGNAFDRGDFLSPLFLMFAPLAFLLRGRRGAVAAVWLAVAVYAGAWFLSSQQTRFLVPIMPPLAILGALGMVALAGRGRLARLAVVAVTVAALGAGAAVSARYAAQFAPVVAGTQSHDEFLRSKTSYHAGIEWMRDHLPPDARVLLALPHGLYLDRDYVLWTHDALPWTADAAETRSFFAAGRFGYAAVLASDEPRRAQLAFIRARQIANVSVREVFSRTRSELGPPQPLLVFSLPR